MLALYSNASASRSFIPLIWATDVKATPPVVPLASTCTSVLAPEFVNCTKSLISLTPAV